MTNQITLSGLSDRNPHFVLVPMWTQGHMIPMVDMALLIADRGVMVSFITTPVNAARIRPIINHAKVNSLPVKFLELRFPCAEAGLPDGCENLDLITNNDLFRPFFEGLSLLQKPLEAYLKETEPAPTCIISDNIQWWTVEVAQKLNIPRLIFHGPSCFFSLCIHNIRQYKVYENVSDISETVLVPNLPQKITTSKAQSPIWFDEPGFEHFLARVTESEETADGVVVNTFKELEPEYVELHEKAVGKRIWPIGPLSLRSKDVMNSARGKKASIDEHRLVSWLDSMAPRSVVLVSFGSLATNSPSQIIEIGRGLEASNQPFIWVIKEHEKCPEVDKWMSDGFEERTRERSLIITGWAPQVVILSHPSVGGFMTHCGWNSILEAISAGVPMVTCPHFGDQFLNEKLVVDMLNIGVALGVEEPGGIAENDKIRVKSNRVEKAVVDLMSGGKEAEERRQRALEFRKMAREAMEGGGSSNKTLAYLIQFAMEPAKKLKKEGN